MSDSVRPRRRQPTRLPHPWDSPSKNTGAGCHFLLQCMKVISEREVAQLCLTPSNPMDCSPPGSSSHKQRETWVSPSPGAYSKKAFTFSGPTKLLLLSHFSHVRLCSVSDSVRSQRWQLPRPWDSPGKNTGVGCHFLLQCIKVKSGSEVAQLCPTLSDPMDCSLPGSSVHGIFQARVLE